MRIAVVGSIPHSLINFRGEMIRRLVQAGAEVVAMAPGHNAAVERALAERGATYRSYKLERAGLNPTSDARTLRSLRRAFADLQPDLVFSYTIKPVVYASLAARMVGVPRRVAMITGLGFAFGSGGGLKQRIAGRAVLRLSRYALSGAEVVFFQNPDDRRIFEENQVVGPGTRVVRINGTGVDLGHFAATPIPEGPPCFLFMGRLLKAKGVPEFFEAAVRLKERYPDARFQLLGALDENPGSISRHELERLTTAGVVEHLGQADDVRPTMAQSSVFVLPTAYREGVPRSIQEALAMGRPVITTDQPGCSDTVEQGTNGFLIPPRNPDALTASMAAFAEDPGLCHRMGAESRRLAEERYDVDRINDVILDALRLG